MSAHGHIPRKRFGQHFLADSGVVAAIIDAIAPRRDDRMVEIGPGLGALTRPLSARLDHLHVVELDRDIVARLQRSFPPQQITVHAGDALRFDFAALGPNLRVVGNLPYNISTPLLFHLGTAAERIIDGHFMLQKEVVDRMVASPSTSAYGRLSVMLQHRFDMEALFDVPPEAFDPPPRVMSAIVRMQPKPAPDPVCGDTFARVVAAAFGQRRKTLRNTLRPLLEPHDWSQLGLNPGLRAEDLPPADFVRIANHLNRE